MFLNRTDNFLVEAWLASIWKKTKDTEGGNPAILSLPFLLLLFPVPSAGLIGVLD